MGRVPRYLIFPLAFLLIVGGFLAWGLTPLGPAPEALNALLPNDAVAARDAVFFEFIPRAEPPSTGLIIYPGGRVDWRSYAPLARAIAEEGYYVAIVPMPLSLAVLAPDKAAEVIASRPAVRTWAIGGHSLGGAMAARFAHQNLDVVQGLVLWAAYPAESDDLTNSGLRVISIFASQDGLATREKIDASRRLLPPDTRWVEISGGNHAQFGWYGDQPGDGTAEIGREEQMRQVAAATVEFLSGLEQKQ